MSQTVRTIARFNYYENRSNRLLTPSSFALRPIAGRKCWFGKLYEYKQLDNIIRRAKAQLLIQQIRWYHSPKRSPKDGDARVNGFIGRVNALKKVSASGPGWDSPLKSWYEVVNAL